MAVELYQELNVPGANTKDITKSIYSELDEAIESCELSDIQFNVLYHRYLKKRPLYTQQGTADALGLAPNKVSEYFGDAITKIHAYMNGETV